MLKMSHRLKTLVCLALFLIFICEFFWASNRIDLTQFLSKYSEQYGLIHLSGSSVDGSNSTANWQKISYSEDGIPSSYDPNYVKQKATFVSLARNSDVWSIASSIQGVEDRFNHRYHYDWVFFNDEEFSEEFINVTKRLISGKVFYEVIPKKHWSYPSWVDQDLAKAGRDKLVSENIIYGGSESYRHMCRFESGFFWQQPIMDKYKYYWRVEPDTKLFCDIDNDLFKEMADNKYKYGFAISMLEFEKTIPTLWQHTKKFISDNPSYVAKDNLEKFITTNDGETYNLCHFWSNFEIADLDFWRSQAYRDYFDYLDSTGGFFYERWGDAPIHSIAASLFLKKSEIHYFGQVGYFHPPFTNCPSDKAVHAKGNCVCNPADTFTWQGYSCTGHYFNVQGLKRPS